MKVDIPFLFNSTHYKLIIRFVTVKIQTHFSAFLFSIATSFPKNKKGQRKESNKEIKNIDF